MQLAIAKMLPRWLIKWATVVLISEVTTGKYSDTVVPELTAVEALRRFDATQESKPWLTTN